MKDDKIIDKEIIKFKDPIDPWNTIHELQAEVEELKGRVDYLEELVGDL